MESKRRLVPLEVIEIAKTRPVCAMCFIPDGPLTATGNELMTATIKGSPITFVMHQQCLVAIKDLAIRNSSPVPLPPPPPVKRPPHLVTRLIPHGDGHPSSPPMILRALP